MAEITKWPDELKVQIPLRFKAGLEKRFNPANAVKDKTRFIIKSHCELCKEHHGLSLYECGKNGFCPFLKFENFYGNACLVWLGKIIGFRHFSMSSSSIVWSISDNEKVRDQLTLLRQAAEQLIEWV